MGKVKGLCRLHPGSVTGLRLDWFEFGEVERYCTYCMYPVK